MRFGGLRIFLLLGEVDPAVHFANSVSIQLEGTLETDILCWKIHLQTSCILLSSRKSPEMYGRERLHVILFEKIAILSLERVSNCTNKLF